MMKKIQFRLGDNEKEIIKIIGVSALVLVSLSSPNSPNALKRIFKMRGQKGFDKLLKHLENKNIIYLGGEKVKLTQKGRNLLKIIRLQEIKIEKPEKWNQIWHLVAYDIPNTRKKERDWFRRIIEKLGFYQIQESLWVFPYECKEEIAIISQDLSISPFVITMNTSNLPNQTKMLKYFSLND